MASVLHGDFETRSAVDLKKSGAEVYARDNSTDILCFGFKFDDEPPALIKRGEPLPHRIVEHVESGGIFVAHNAAFELAIWNYVCVPKYGWPTLKPEQVQCTMCMAYAMALPGSLEKAAAAVGIEQQKDMAGYRIMLQLSQPRDIDSNGIPVWWDENEFAAKYEALGIYCLQDVNVEHELFVRLLKLSPKEREIWLLDQKINQRGIQIDLKAVKNAIKLVENEQDRLNLEMRMITGNQVATCTATKQLTDWLQANGIECDGVAKSDITELLSRPNLPDKVRTALLLRKEAAKSSTAKLKAMFERAGTDGRVRGIFQYHGAGTGRWAGRGIQPQNFPRGELLKQNEIEEVLELLGRAE